MEAPVHDLDEDLFPNEVVEWESTSHNPHSKLTWVAQFFPLITGIGFIIFGVIMGLVKKWQPVLFAVSFTIGVGLTAGGILLFWVLSKRSSTSSYKSIAWGSACIAPLSTQPLSPSLIEFPSSMSDSDVDHFNRLVIERNERAAAYVLYIPSPLPHPLPTLAPPFNSSHWVMRIMEEHVAREVPGERILFASYSFSILFKIFCGIVIVYMVALVFTQIIFTPFTLLRFFVVLLAFPITFACVAAFFPNAGGIILTDSRVFSLTARIPWSSWFMSINQRYNMKQSNYRDVPLCHTIYKSSTSPSVSPNLAPMIEFFGYPSREGAALTNYILMCACQVFARSRNSNVASSTAANDI